MDEPRITFKGEIKFGKQTMGANKKIDVVFTAESEAGLARVMREAACFIRQRGLAGPFSHSCTQRVRVRERWARKFQTEKISFSLNCFDENGGEHGKEKENAGSNVCG